MSSWNGRPKWLDLLLPNFKYDNLCLKAGKVAFSFQTPFEPYPHCTSTPPPNPSPLPTLVLLICCSTFDLPDSPNMVHWSVQETDPYQLGRHPFLTSKDGVLPPLPLLPICASSESGEQDVLLNRAFSTNDDVMHLKSDAWQSYCVSLHWGERLDGWMAPLNTVHALSQCYTDRCVCASVCTC